MHSKTGNVSECPGGIRSSASASNRVDSWSNIPKRKNNKETQIPATVTKDAVQNAGRNQGRGKGQGNVRGNYEFAFCFFRSMKFYFKI